VKPYPFILGYPVVYYESNFLQVSVQAWTVAMVEHASILRRVLCVSVMMTTLENTALMPERKVFFQLCYSQLDVCFFILFHIFLDLL